MPGPGMVTIPELRAWLRARGERMTQPRRVVLAVLADHADHLSAEQVVTAVEERDPSVHRSTVYRTLETSRLSVWFNMSIWGTVRPATTSRLSVEIMCTCNACPVVRSRTRRSTC